MARCALPLVIKTQRNIIACSLIQLRAKSLKGADWPHMHRPPLNAASRMKSGGDVPNKGAVTIGVALVAVTAEDRRHARRQVMAPDLVLPRHGHEQRILLHNSASGDSVSLQGVPPTQKGQAWSHQMRFMLHSRVPRLLCECHMLGGVLDPSQAAYLSIEGKVPG